MLVNIGGSYKTTSNYWTGSGSAGTGAESFVTNILSALTTLAGLYFLIMFVLGGIKWISAGGDSGKVDTAKSQLTSSAIGLIVVVSAWAIAFIISQVLGIDILNPSRIINSL